MKKQFLLIFCYLFIYSCDKKSVSEKHDQIYISQNLSYEKDNGLLKLKSGKFNYTIKTQDLPFKKVILLNSSLLGYLEALNSADKIIAVTSPEYIYSDEITDLIKNGRIKSIGNEQKYDIEQIISLKPDVIFTNYIPNFENTYTLLRKNNIQILFFDEYSEQNPLEKSAYIKIFGELLGKKAEAEKIYADIKSNYQALKKEAAEIKTKPEVLVNEMYGNEWFLAGGKSNMAQFISDANADYIFGDNTESRSIPLSFEEVFVRSKNAEYWVNVGDHKTKKELLQINPSYARMKVFQSGNLYSVTGKIRGKSNDYFESGVLWADLVLKDYIKIFHPDLFKDYRLTYLQKLK